MQNSDVKRYQALLSTLVRILRKAAFAAKVSILLIKEVSKWKKCFFWRLQEGSREEDNSEANFSWR